MPLPYVVLYSPAANAWIPCNTISQIDANNFTISTTTLAIDCTLIAWFGPWEIIVVWTLPSPPPTEQNVI